MPKLHLDTDIGGDIDDLCALVMVLNWPDADLLAITTNQDERGRRAGYARYALRLAGRDDILVAAGADASLDCYRIYPGLPDEAVYWPEPIPPAPTPPDRALDLLQCSIEQGAIIVAIGAYTNLALLERRSPGILHSARLFLMGGYVFPPREGFPAWSNEMDWNIQNDIGSAQTVIEHSNPTLVPLPVTIETSLRRAYLPALKQAGPLAQLIARQAEAFAVEYGNEAQYGRTCRNLPDDIINFQHDPLACAIALGWRDGVEISEMPLKLAVEDGWLAQRIADGGKPAKVVTRVNGSKFNEFWLETVTSDRAAVQVASMGITNSSEGSRPDTRDASPAFCGGVDCVAARSA
jgi:purine nucleosidase